MVTLSLMRVHVPMATVVRRRIPPRTDNPKGHGTGFWACCSKMTDDSISLTPREILRSRDSRTTTNDVIIIFHYWRIGINAEYLGNYEQTHFRGVVNGMQ